MRRTSLAHLRRHAVGYLALFVALGGTSYAATRLPANSVDTRAIQSGAVTASKLGRLPAVSAFASGTDQRLGDGVWATLRLPRETFDIGGMHSTGDNDSRVVAPRTGTYVIDGKANFEPGVCCGSRFVEISLHRADGGTTGIDRAQAGSDARAHASGIVRMRAGDYVELLVLETSNPVVGVGGRLSVAYLGG